MQLTHGCRSSSRWMKAAADELRVSGAGGGEGAASRETRGGADGASLAVASACGCRAALPGGSFPSLGTDVGGAEQPSAGRVAAGGGRGADVGAGRAAGGCSTQASASTGPASSRTSASGGTRATRRRGGSTRYGATSAAATTPEPAPTAGGSTRAPDRCGGRTRYGAAAALAAQTGGAHAAMSAGPSGSEHGTSHAGGTWADAATRTGGKQRAGEPHRVTDASTPNDRRTTEYGVVAGRESESGHAPGAPESSTDDASAAPGGGGSPVGVAGASYPCLSSFASTFFGSIQQKWHRVDTSMRRSALICLRRQVAGLWRVFSGYPGEAVLR